MKLPKLKLKLPALFARTPRTADPDDAPRRKPVQTAFAEDVFFGSTLIGKREAVKYINGSLQNHWKSNNYYYAYYYHNKRLNFVGCRSDEHIHGRLALLAPALMKPGEYYLYLEDKAQYFVVTHRAQTKSDNEERISSAVAHSRPMHGIDLADTELLKSLGKIPDSLKFRWSNQTASLQVMALVIPLFLVSLGAWGYYFLKLRDLPTPASGAHVVNTDLTGTIQRIGEAVSGKGQLTKITSDGKNSTFVIKFNDDVSTRQFLSKFGGELSADNKILLTAPVAGGR